MKKLRWAVVIVILIVAVKWYCHYDNETGILRDTQTVVKGLGFSAEDTAYLNGVLERAHPAAFEDAYNMGTRHRPAAVNQEQYVKEVFGAMIQSCKADGRTDLVDGLQKALEQNLAILRT